MRIVFFRNSNQRCDTLFPVAKGNSSALLRPCFYSNAKASVRTSVGISTILHPFDTLLKTQRHTKKGQNGCYAHSCPYIGLYQYT